MLDYVTLQYYNQMRIYESGLQDCMPVSYVRNVSVNDRSPNINRTPMTLASEAVGSGIFRFHKLHDKPQFES